MMIGQASSGITLNDEKLELLRQRINDENYLHAAIHRLALVLSKELMLITSEGGNNEQRKRRK